MSSVEEFTYDKHVSFIIIVTTYEGILTTSDYIESDALNSYSPRSMYLYQVRQRIKEGLI